MQFPDIERLTQAARARQYVDGLWEIAMGVFFLLMAVLMGWQAQTLPKSEWSLLFSLGMPLVLVLGSVALGRLVTSARARYVWPRTGYAEFSLKGAHPALRTALIGFVAGAVFGLVYALAKMPQIAIAFTGLVAAVIFAYVGYQLGLRRFYLIAVWSLVVTAIILVMGLPQLEGLAAFWLAVGGGFLISGIFNFIRYLRTAPTPSGQ